MHEDQVASLQEHLAFLYGEDAADSLWSRLSTKLSAFAAEHPEFTENVPPPSERLSEKDAILITYGNQVSEQNRSRLGTRTEDLAT